MCNVQALRQSLLKKYATIRNHVERLHNSRMSPYEKLECLEAIRSEVAASWRTDEIRRQKPTPQARPGSGDAAHVYIQQIAFAWSVPLRSRAAQI